MAADEDDVLSWLSTLSYNELRRLAAEYSVKSKQKREKLINLLKKVVKAVPKQEEVVCGNAVSSQENGEQVAKNETRKRKHSVDEGQKVQDDLVSSLLPPVQTAVVEVVEPVVKRQCAECEEFAAKSCNEDLVEKTANLETVEQPVDVGTSEKSCEEEGGEKPADEGASEKPTDEGASGKPADEEASGKPAGEEASGRPAGEDTMNTTFELPDPTPHLSLPDVSLPDSLESRQNADIAKNTDRSSWISEDGGSVKDVAVKHNLTQDQSFVDILSEDGMEIDVVTNTEVKVKFTETKEYLDQNNDMTVPHESNSDGNFGTFDRIGMEDVLVEENLLDAKDSSSEQNEPEKAEGKSVEMHNSLQVETEGLFASAEDEQANNKLTSSNDVGEPSASTKRLHRGEIAAHFAAKHKKLMQGTTNIEEDARRIQDLHRKHEDEVPSLFKRLATPKREKKSGIPVPLRRTASHHHEKGYDFSHAPNSVAKMTFKFGEVDPGKTGDVQKTFNVAQSPGRTALHMRNKSVPPNLEAEADQFADSDDAHHLIGSCPRFLKNHATPDRKTITPASKDVASTRVRIIPFVDTTSMTDAQFHMAKIEGKIPCYSQANRKNGKAERSE